MVPMQRRRTSTAASYSCIVLSSRMEMPHVSPARYKLIFYMMMLSPSGNLHDDGVERSQPPRGGSLTQRVAENNAFCHAPSHDSASFRVGELVCVLRDKNTFAVGSGPNGTVEKNPSVGCAAPPASRRFSVNVTVNQGISAFVRSVWLQTRNSNDKDGQESTRRCHG